jgi:hypothetical protein
MVRLPCHCRAYKALTSYPLVCTLQLPIAITGYPLNDLHMHLHTRSGSQLDRPKQERVSLSIALPWSLRFCLRMGENVKGSGGDTHIGGNGAGAQRVQRSQHICSQIARMDGREVGVVKTAGRLCEDPVQLGCLADNRWSCTSPVDVFRMTRRSLIGIYATRRQFFLRSRP